MWVNSIVHVWKKATYFLPLQQSGSHNSFDHFSAAELCLWSSSTFLSPVALSQKENIWNHLNLIIIVVLFQSHKTKFTMNCEAFFSSFPYLTRQLVSISCHTLKNNSLPVYFSKDVRWKHLPCHWFELYRNFHFFVTLRGVMAAHHSIPCIL